MMTYKGYLAKIEFDEKADVFHGEVINIRDVITFQGQSVSELKQSFIDSVEDYLEFCALRNEIPDKPFSGKFNLRLTPELHRQAYITACQHGLSLNQWVIEAIQHELKTK